MNRLLKEFNPRETDIALCGSMSHRREMLKLSEKLKNNGYKLSTPDLTAEPLDYDTMDDVEIRTKKGYFLRRHLANILRADAILIANYTKNGIDGYIGANTLIEMCAAFLEDKTIYVLNPVSPQVNYEEALAFQPIVIYGDLSKILVKE